MIERPSRESEANTSYPKAYELLSLAMTRAPQGNPETAARILAGEFMGLSNKNKQSNASFSDLWDLNIDNNTLSTDMGIFRESIEDTIDLINNNDHVLGIVDIATNIQAIPSEKIQNYLRDYAEKVKIAHEQGIRLVGGRIGYISQENIYAMLLLPESCMDYHYQAMMRVHELLRVNAAPIPRMVLAFHTFHVVEETMRIFGSQLYRAGVEDKEKGIGIREVRDIRDRMEGNMRDVKHGLTGLSDVLSRIKVGLPLLDSDTKLQFEGEYEYAKMIGKQQVRVKKGI